MSSSGEFGTHRVACFQSEQFARELCRSLDLSDFVSLARQFACYQMPFFPQFGLLGHGSVYCDSYSHRQCCVASDVDPARGPSIPRPQERGRRRERKRERKRESCFLVLASCRSGTLVSSSNVVCVDFWKRAWEKTDALLVLRPELWHAGLL